MSRFLKIVSITGYTLCIYVCVSLFASVFCLAGDALFTLKNSDMMLITPENVEINGIKRVGRQEVLLVAGLDRKISFFDVDVKKISASLTTCGWVKKAFAEKFFPDSVKITIEEFKPAIIVNSQKRSSETDKEVFTMWFADSDGIVFKRALPNEVVDGIPILMMNYYAQDEDDKRTEKIKKAIFIAEKWKNISSLCILNTINYDVFSGYSIECSGKNEMRSTIRLSDDFSDAEWVAMMEEAVSAADLLFGKKNQWAGEYVFDKVENNYGEKKYEMIIGKRMSLK